MAQSKDKGDVLETAVQHIENLILSTSPNLKERPFTIQSKKLLTVAGVRHEIDLYVRIDAGDGYESIFIFECKNWAKPVGKNDIIVFSEKIKACAAQRGYFIARKFSKHARAQAQQEPRMSLHVASELDISQVNLPINLHYLLQEDIKAFVKFLSSIEETGIPIDVSIAVATLDNQPINLEEYVKEWLLAVIQEDTRTFPSANLPEANYPRSAQDIRTFETSEFIVNDKRVIRAELEVNYIARVKRPTIESTFDIAARGRIYNLQRVETSDGSWFQFVIASRS